MVLFLNLYAPITIRNLTLPGRRNSVEDKARLIVSAFSNYEELDRERIELTLESVGDLRSVRVLITDAGARCIYDSLVIASAENKLVFYPEIAEALEGNEAIHIRFVNTIS